MEHTSPLSYAELDNPKDLKSSDPETFTKEMLRLLTISQMKIIGSCSETHNRHMECIAKGMSRKNYIK